MFVYVMFASHPTIVALHANSCCKYLKLLVQILLIRLCLQCITGAVCLARCDRNHADFAVFRFIDFINMQLCLKKSSSTNFLRKVFLDKFSAKNQPGVPTDRPRGLRKSRDSNAPMMCFNPKLSHKFVTPFRDFSVLRCFSLRCFDFTNGSKRVPQVRSTSGRDGRFYQKHKLNCEINC